MLNQHFDFDFFLNSKNFKRKHFLIATIEY